MLGLLSNKKDRLAEWKSELRSLWAMGKRAHCDTKSQLKQFINELEIEIREEDLNGQSTTDWKHMMDEDELKASATVFALKQDYENEEDGDVHWWLDIAHSILVADRCLRSGARALLAMGRAVAAAGVLPREASLLLSDAETKVRDVVVWRCHVTAPDNRQLFKENLMAAFGDELTDHLRARLLNGHRRCVFDRVKDSFQSNGMQNRLKRGHVRPSRHKIPSIDGDTRHPPGLKSELGMNNSVPWMTPMPGRTNV